MKNAVRIALGVTGVAAKMYAGYILKKEIDRKREADRQGKEYELANEDYAKLVVSAVAGITCSAISRSMHVSMLKDMNNSYRITINDLTGKLAKEQLAALDARKYAARQHLEKHNWISLCNDITSIASLDMNKDHFKNYESNLHKLANKYVFQNSGITFSGINSYEACRTQAANTLSDTAMDDIKNFTAATLKQIEEAIV